MADPGLTAGAELLARAAAAAGSGGGAPGVTVEEVTQRHDGDTVEARSTSARIKTVADLLEHIQADLSRYEVAASEATCWEGLTADRATGRPIVTTLHRVWVRLKPRAGPGVKECVEAMIAAASRQMAVPAAGKHRRRRDGLWSLLVVSDLHVGSKSWRHTAGHDYDLNIASRIAEKTTSELIERSAAAGVTRRSIVLCGDTMHFDTVAGTTTGGTYLDRDTRLPKAIETAAEVIFRAVDQSAEAVPTDVVMVPGNHDTAMTWALQKILAERYRLDERVTVNREFTSRKYLVHGKNLIGVTHGDKAKKKLAGIMALEASKHWAECVHREWHVGHLHHQAAEISTIDGVVVRTHPTIVPPDAWHTESGFVGAEQGMQGCIYTPEGGLLELHMAYAPRPA